MAKRLTVIEKEIRVIDDEIAALQHTRARLAKLLPAAKFVPKPPAAKHPRPPQPPPAATEG
jgi:hypothetical protein